jgi:hypothetical protein
MGRHKPQPHFTVGSEPEHLRFSTLAGNRMWKMQVKSHGHSVQNPYS